MIKVYALTTMACILGWVRLIPLFKKRKWVRTACYLVACVGLWWGNQQLLIFIDPLSDDKKWQHMGYYFGYLLILSIFLYHLLQYAKRK